MKRTFLVLVLISLAGAACSSSNTIAQLPPQSAAPEQTVAPDAHRAGSQQYKRVTVAIKDPGSTYTFPTFGNFKGKGSYTKNDASANATLQITNSGPNNLLGVPVSATGAVQLYFEAQIAGAYEVTFQNVAKTMTLTSTTLKSTATYAISVYLWNKQIEYYTAGTPSNGTLTFQTPFSGLQMSYYTPIMIELLEVGSPTASPSPTPTPTMSPPPTATPSPPPTPTASPPPTPTPSPSPTPTATPNPQTLYAAYNDPVYGGVYAFNGNQFGSGPTNFTSLPSAFAAGVDDLQNLYVSSSSGYVQELYPGGGTFTYDQSVAHPSSVAAYAGYNPAIDVANGSGISGYAQMLTFQQGVDQSTPSTDPNLISVAGVALDAAGNLYAGGTNNQNAPEVDLIASGGSPTNLGLQLAGTPTGLAVDQTGNLLVAQTNGIAVYAPGESTPVSWIGSYGQTPFALAFGNAGNWLYVLYDGIPCYASCIDVYAYPAGTLLGQYGLNGSSEYYGVAISPRVPLFNPNAMRRKHPHFRYWTNVRHMHLH